MSCVTSHGNIISPILKLRKGTLLLALHVQSYYIPVISRCMTRHNFPSKTTNWLVIDDVAIVPIPSSRTGLVGDMKNLSSILGLVAREKVDQTFCLCPMTPWGHAPIFLESNLFAAPIVTLPSQCSISSSPAPSYYHDTPPRACKFLQVACPMSDLNQTRNNTFEF